MALEAVVYPQDPFGYSRDQYYALAGGLPELADEKTFLDAFNDDPTANNACCWDYYSSSSANTSAMHGVSISSGQWPALDPSSSSPETTCATAAAAAAEAGSGGCGQPSPSAAGAGGGGGGGGGRRKRRRSRSSKNKEEIENQRMTHIAVERNRRKQMNEYLAALRSLMPPSYSQRGDQASIIGGAINFVKELEQLLQSMQTHKSKPKPLQDLAATAAAAANNNNDNSNNDGASPFAEFFSFPQYSTRPASAPCGGPTEPAMALEDRSGGPHPQWVVADIEVTMVESHANMKILSKKRPRQLLQLLAGLQGLRLTVLHLNITTVDDLVLYSVSVKVEEGCHLNTVDEIAAAVHELLRRIEEGAGAFT